jgi:hypothetical protein
MRKQWVLFAVILLAAAFFMVGSAHAAVTKYTFNDIDVEDTIVEIAASVKVTNKVAFSTCSYFADDYAGYLGYYAEDVAAGSTADEVLAFCVANFDARDPA